MKNPKPPNKCQVRIIGGKWRSRKIHFPDEQQLRPTPDRIRETLFNWLAPFLSGATCLDLFAGSGALGFEALSRGAAWVTMVDQSPKIIHKLRENAELLKTSESIEFHCAKVPNSLVTNKKPFDLIFLDPPFHQHLVADCCRWLEKEGFLKQDSLVYIETEAELPPSIPNYWQILKEKQAGQVRYYLAKVGEQSKSIMAPSEDEK